MLVRRLVAGLAACLYGFLSPAIAQRDQPPRIGFLSLISVKSDSRLPSFIQGLKEFGYVEGRNLRIEWRSAEGVADRLPGLAKELVDGKVDLIVAIQPQAVDAARAATKEVPIVFAAAQDPVGMGMARSLSRPGGNITGASAMATDVLPKQLQLMQRVIPKLSRVAILLNPTNPAGSRVVRTSFEQAGAAARISVLFIEAQNREQIATAYSRAKAAQADAVIAGPDSFFVQSRAEMAKAALAHGLPTMFLQREHAVAGGMMSYGPNMSQNYRRAAY